MEAKQTETSRLYPNAGTDNREGVLSPNRIRRHSNKQRTINHRYIDHDRKLINTIRAIEKQRERERRLRRGWDLREREQRDRRQNSFHENPLMMEKRQTLMWERRNQSKWQTSGGEAMVMGVFLKKLRAPQVTVGG